MSLYDEVQQISRDEAVNALASEDPSRVCRALVAIAFHDDDWRWVQETCLVYLLSRDPQISGVAATCLGHVARIHNILDKEKVLSALRARASDPEISGRISDAIDDVEMFVASHR